MLMLINLVTISQSQDSINPKGWQVYRKSLFLINLHVTSLSIFMHKKEHEPRVDYLDGR